MLPNSPIRATNAQMNSVLQTLWMMLEVTFPTQLATLEISLVHSSRYIDSDSLYYPGSL